MKTLKGKHSLANEEIEDISTSLLDNDEPNVVTMRYRTAAFSLLLAALLGALGFWIGQYGFQRRSHHFRNQLTENTINFRSAKYDLRAFIYNETFASAPSEETNMAWDSLFPSKLSVGLLDD